MNAQMVKVKTLTAFKEQQETLHVITIAMI